MTDGGAGASADTDFRRMRPLLGTFVEVCAAGSDRASRAAVEAAFDRIAQVHQLLSFQRPDSELSRLNANPGRWSLVSPVTRRVLRLARAMSLASNHAFDCTVGGALVARGVLPDQTGHPCEPRGHAGDIELAGNRARLRRPVRVTLDGIAKGFAVDRAIWAMKQARIRYGWVNAGGDLRVFGDFPLPVAQRLPDGTLRPLGHLCDGALATSHIDGIPDPDRPGLIVDGRVEPESTGTRTPPFPWVVSVVARFAWRADALTKVAATTAAPDRAEAVARLGGRLV